METIEQHILTLDVAHRFWQYVTKGDDDACWPWEGSRTSDGYGQLSVDGIARRAHRIAYTLLIGPIPDDTLVLHSCDNPPCVNPRHLFAGSDAVNAADRAAKGRSGNRPAPLTPGQRTAICAEYRAGTSQAQLAERHGVTTRTIRRVLKDGAAQRRDYRKPEYVTVDLPLAPLPPHQLTLDLPPMARAGAAANTAAAARAFSAYRERVADETRRRHDADLGCFSGYLAAMGLELSASALASDAGSWANLTWGLVAGFVAWQSAEGYAIGSINVRLSTIKAYAKLAAKAGALGADAYAQIRLVQGFRHAEGRRVDAKREQTRKEGGKKAAPVRISQAHASLLKQQADPRDRLLMCLLLDHGLRVGEVASLTAADFDLTSGVLRFYRQKVDKTQRHLLSGDTLAAALAAFASDEASGPLFGVDRTIRRTVGQLGAAVGLPTLSPHDCRHAWATFATRAGTPTKALQDAGGWSSPAMPLRYAESAEIANDGVKLR